MKIITIHSVIYYNYITFYGDDTQPIYNVNKRFKLVEHKFINRKNINLKYHIK